MRRFEAVSFEALAVRDGLRFPIPRRESYANEDAAAFWWALLQFCFPLDDPNIVSPLSSSFTLSDEDRTRLRRYVEVSDRLAASTVLNSDISVEVSIPDDDGPEVVVETFTAADNEAGFAALFRQLYSPDEKASFASAHGILARELKDSTERFATLRQWGMAAGALRGKSARRIACERLGERGLAPPNLDGYPDQRTPEESISHYFYGDHLHWDRNAAVIEQHKEDPFIDAWERLAFLNATAGLAHLYIGFSVLVEQSLGASV